MPRPRPAPHYQPIAAPATLSAQQIAAVQTRLREALGLPPENFPAAAFIGMVSDEIEQLRAQGRTDVEIAALMRSVDGVAVDAEEIGRHYAPPAARGRPPG